MVKQQRRSRASTSATASLHPAGIGIGRVDVLTAVLHETLDDRLVTQPCPEAEEPPQP